MARSRSPSSQQQRQLLAEACARLMAADGLTDHTMAKRKAARQLGCDDTRNLPSNEEIDEALRQYRQLYQRESHPEILHLLRLKARDWLRRLGDFDPWLIGSVLSGTAGDQSEVDLLILSDDPKSVEFFLLNADVDYRHAHCAHPDGVCMHWVDDDIPVRLFVMPRSMARYKSQQERVRLEGLEALLAGDA